MNTIQTYWPELGEHKPDCQIEESYASPGHSCLVTPLVLSGRGIRRTQTYTAADLTEYAQYKVGWHKYYVTERALLELRKLYTISRSALLD